MCSAQACLILHSCIQPDARQAQDATELSDLWANIDSLFTAGDVHRIAAALGTMSRSAPMVAEMPGLQGMPARLPVSPPSGVNQAAEPVATLYRTLGWLQGTLNLAETE